MPSGAYTKVAGGNIAPSRFVILDTADVGKVDQAGAGGQVWGISERGTRNLPFDLLDDGFAAIAGENISVVGNGDEALLELGGTVAVGDRLKADADGKGVVADTDLDEYGAIAEMSGVDGDLIKVRVFTGRQMSIA